MSLKVRGVMTMNDNDPVNRPTHYNQSGIECIDAIEASMSKVEFEGYLKGNAEKYLWRYRYKTPIHGDPREDLNKAGWYLKKLIENEPSRDDLTKENIKSLIDVPSNADLVREFNEDLHDLVQEKWRENENILRHNPALDVAMSSTCTVKEPTEISEVDYTHVIDFRKALILEETKELLDEMPQLEDSVHDHEHMLKEACDVLYVVYGLAAALGWDIDHAFKRVHANNMLKLQNGSIRDDGKLLKPTNHPKVDLSDLVAA